VLVAPSAASFGVDLIGNTIEGGTGSGCVLPPVGIDSEGTAQLNIRRNVIIGDSSNNYGNGM
jgi:hypothetical protein